MAKAEAEAIPNHAHHHHDPERALKDLFAYPFMSALTERRTRRMPRGVSIDAGPLSWESKNPPAPLTKLEEAMKASEEARKAGKKK